VIVSASREAQSGTEAPVAISTLSPQVLGGIKATSLEQVLNKVSGVYMVDLGNEQHFMAIRQPISTRSVFLYLEDGIPIRTSGDFNHNALIEINQAALKTIEVIRGPASSLYGSEAIGGAVNFITQAPSSVPTASVQAEAGTGATATPGCKPRAPGAGWVYLPAPTTRGNATASDSTATTTNWPSRSGPTIRSANAPNL
jgi:outer membrane receptor for ferrienterochelin and colicin